MFFFRFLLRRGQVGILYMSFMFFTQQFNASRVKEAVKVMQESEEDEVSAVLKPVPKEDESVSIITRYPHALRCMPTPIVPLDMCHFSRHYLHHAKWERGNSSPLSVYPLQIPEEERKMFLLLLG